MPLYQYSAENTVSIDYETVFLYSNTFTGLTLNERHRVIICMALSAMNDANLYDGYTTQAELEQLKNLVGEIIARCQNF